MVKLTASERSKYNRFDNRIFNELMFSGNNDLYLNGSYQTVLFSWYASDVDLYQPVEWSSFIAVVNEIRRLAKSVNVTEIKFGQTKVFSEQELQGFSNDELRVFVDGAPFKRIKLDVWVKVGRYLEEVTIIYDFDSGEGEAEIVEKLLDDVKKYSMGKRYYKAGKRLQSLLRVLDMKTREREVDDVLKRPELGLLYLTKMRVETLLNVKAPLGLKNEVLDALKNDVRRLGLLDGIKPKFDRYTVAGTEAIQRKLQADLNVKMLPFLVSLIPQKLKL